MRKLHIEKRSVKLRTRLARYSDVHKNIVLFSRDDQEMIYSKKFADRISGTVKAEYGLFSMAIQGLLLRLFFFGTKKQPPLRQTIIPHTFCEQPFQVLTQNIFMTKLYSNDLLFIYFLFTFYYLYLKALKVKINCFIC
jgi:hypothetical protein